MSGYNARDCADEYQARFSRAEMESRTGYRRERLILFGIPGRLPKYCELHTVAGRCVARVCRCYKIQKMNRQTDYAHNFALESGATSSAGALF